MYKILKWKKPLYFAMAAGIIGFSTYGIYQTAQAYYDIEKLQPGNAVLSSDLNNTKDSLSAWGPLCSPLGCAACNGCVYTQYRQNIEVLPDSDVQIELTD